MDKSSGYTATYLIFPLLFTQLCLLTCLVHLLHQPASMQFPPQQGQARADKPLMPGLAQSAARRAGAKRWVCSYSRTSTKTLQQSSDLPPPVLVDGLELGIPLSSKSHLNILRFYIAYINRLGLATLCMERACRAACSGFSLMQAPARPISVGGEQVAAGGDPRTTP